MRDKPIFTIDPFWCFFGTGFVIIGILLILAAMENLFLGGFP